MLSAQFRRILLAAMMVSTAASASQVPTQSIPASADECLQSAFDIAEKAETQKLTNDELDKVDDLLSKMETYCDAQQFGEAMLVHDVISSLIEPR